MGYGENSQQNVDTWTSDLSQNTAINHEAPSEQTNDKRNKFKLANNKNSQEPQQPQNQKKELRLLQRQIDQLKQEHQADLNRRLKEQE